MNLISYIKETFPKCIRINTEDEGNLIGLPYPYTVPSISDAFQEMYYWDTYFINNGLIKIGMTEQAINNTENMFYLIERYGFMPNGNRTGYLNNSQPPFLSLMVKDIFEETGDKEWLKRAVEILKKEYDFWQNKRHDESGFGVYGGNVPNPEGTCKYFISRIGKRPEGYSDEQLAKHCRATCESGWDMSARFNFSITDYAPVCLNSLLWALENNLYEFSEILGNDDALLWKEKADSRKTLMLEFMEKDGVFADYNLKENKRSGFVSCANFYPMWLGMLSQNQAEQTAKLLSKLESEFGVFVTEKIDTEYIYQWGYPNGWAPLHFIVIKALLRYGFNEDAKRIAKKYVALVEKCFDETENLWEKYNVLGGNILVSQEGDHSKMPTMMGWSAGVYVFAKGLLDE